MADDITCVKARIRGRVQGVGFRAWTVREAHKLGLNGSVRNEADGSVSAVIVGPKQAVDSLVERLHVGPRGSAVTNVEHERITLDVIPDDFVVIH